jgi:MFS transporter, ACS family, glucarate transporter
MNTTHVRYKVVALAVTLAGVTYLDRACIGTCAPGIMHDLGLSKDQMSLVYSAFALAYALFEIPTAWWADRRGTRHVLTRIVVWWSAFTMLIATAWNFASLLTMNFLFGCGEAGAWPSVARTFSRWVPRTERGRVQGIFFSGAHLAGGLTPLLVIWLTQTLHLNWRTVFLMFGVIGVVWAVTWFRWFRNDPSEHPQVSPAELATIVADRAPVGGHHEGWAYWKRLLSHPNTLPLCAMYFPNSYAFYFCLTWLPTYLKEKHGLDAVQLGLFAGLPLILSVGGDLFGGVATDLLTRRFGLRVGRCGLGATAYVLAGLSMILATVVPQPMLAATLIAVAVAASMFTLGASWSTCIDIGGNHAGVVSAAMNTSGALSSVISPLMVTWLLAACGNWNAPLYVMGGLFLMGAVCWSFINPHKRIFD